VENEEFNKFESVYSNKVRAGKRRTYFFDVRKTKKEDFYITITESTRRFDGNGYERHKIFLYKEDFNRFSGALNEVIDHVKTNLMPDFDYDYYAKRQEEWEAQQAAEAAAAAETATVETSTATEPESTTTEDSPSTSAESAEPTAESTEKSADSEAAEEDMSW